jgi:hypothetical protein
MSPLSFRLLPCAVARLSLLLLLALPAAASAQYGYMINADGTVSITRYSGPGGNLALPDRLNGRTVSRIGIRSFENTMGLTGVMIPNTVTQIAAQAFMSCRNLAAVAIPSSVKRLDDGAFAFTALTSVKVPDSVVHLGDQTFLDCHRLTSVQLGKSITNLGFFVFTGCSNLTQVTIPSRVRAIQAMAFGNCARLQRVLVGAGVREIWVDAFRGCPRLTAVNFQGHRPALVLGNLFSNSTRAVSYYLPWRTGWGATYGGRPAKPGDAYEPDNSRSAAKVLPKGQTQFRSIHRAGNADWAKFTIGAAGARNLRIDTAGASGDLEMWLYKGNGQLVAYDDDSGPGRYPRLTVATLNRGTYFIKLQEKGHDGTLPFFSLTARWTAR